MRTSQYSVSQLEKEFERQIILDMKTMKAFMGTDVDMTIHRILNQLCYMSSYSHAGKYYSLNRLAKFDSHGLWHFDDIHFSKNGTLKKTILELNLLIATPIHLMQGQSSVISYPIYAM